MSPLYIEFVEKIFIVGPVTGIMHVCYFLYVSKCLISFAWQHNFTTVCKLICYEKILLIKMYRTHSHISFLINFYRPNWTFYWKSYAVRWVVCYLFNVGHLFWLLLSVSNACRKPGGTVNDAMWQLLIYGTGKWHIKMNKMCLFALHVRKTVYSCLSMLFLNCPFSQTVMIQKFNLFIFYVKLLNAYFEHCVILSWH